MSAPVSVWVWASVRGKARSFDIGDETYNLSKVSDSAFVFGYQALAGVAYPMSETTEIRGGYRYFAATKGKFDDIEASFASHNFEVGLLFRF